MSRCAMCYQDRTPARSQPLAGVSVCGGCAMDIGRVTGFLATRGYGLSQTFDRELKLINLDSGEVQSISLELIRSFRAAAVETGSDDDAAGRDGPQLRSMDGSPPAEPPKPPRKARKWPPTVEVVEGDIC